MSDSKNIRNFGFIAHIDAGKTTTTERVLYVSGDNYRIGEVDEGTTTTDWMVEEKERGITITSAAVSCNWKDSVFHIIDTPGHVDFTAEVQRSLRILDGAVVVFCGVSGVQTQSETVWRQADNYNIPRIVFINKLDRTGADFENTLKEIEEKFNITPLPINIPYYNNDALKAVINLISMKMELFKDDGLLDEVVDIPDSDQEKADIYREKLIDILTAHDDALLESALAGTLKESEIVQSIRRGTLSRKFVPVLCGASFKNIGIPELLDAIDLYLPSPDDVGEIDGYLVKKDTWEKVKFDANGPVVAYIFKVQYSREKGIIAFVRIYSGKIKNGDTLFNPRTKKKERLNDLLKVYADKFERIDTAVAGDIVTVSGIKQAVTGDTFCTENHQVLLETLDFPEPVLYIRIEPKNALDREKLNTAKDHLLLEDPTITCKDDPETGQTLIGGMGELHVEIFLERIKNAYGIELKSGAPQVVYRETPKKRERFSYNFDKKVEGNVQHILITLEAQPLERDSGNKIISDLDKKDLVYLPYIEKGINSALQAGPEAAYPVIDCQIKIVELNYDASKTSAIGFEAAASLCCSYLLREAGMHLLEPIMKLEIDVPSESTGAVIGELQSRNGIIIDIQKKINQDVIFAKAPLKVMFGYTTVLRSQTQGKGNFSMEFLHYDTTQEI